MSDLKVWSQFFESNDENSAVNIVQLDDGSFWFQFSHLAKLLGYSNPTVALKTHCEDYEIQKFDIGKHETVNFVSESGFYSLVLGSQKPLAKLFKKWICSDVLPKLRAESGYIMPTASSDEVKALVKAHEKALAAKDRQYKRLEDGSHSLDEFFSECMYVMESEDSRGSFFAETYGVYLHWCKNIKRKNPVSIYDFEKISIQRFGAEYVDNSNFKALRIKPEFLTISHSAKSVGRFK